jgi:hypothetical protein
MLEYLSSWLIFEFITSASRSHQSFTMTNTFADLHFDWCFTSVTINEGEHAPSLRHHDGQPKSNRNSNGQLFGNDLHGQFHRSDTTSNVDDNSPSSHTCSYPIEQCVTETSHTNVDLSFNTAHKNDLAVQWSEQVQNVPYDVNFGEAQAVEYTDYTFQ